GLGVVRDALGCDRAVGEERELEAHHGGGAGVVSSACREERGEADQEDHPGVGEAVSHLYCPFLPAALPRPSTSGPRPTCPSRGDGPPSCAGRRRGLGWPRAWKSVPGREGPPHAGPACAR